jgi:hypothetical protein
VTDYSKALQDFVQRLTTDQQKKYGPSTYAAYESGRKYDKILIDIGSQRFARYFVNRSTGDIYGAKSFSAPNLKWWFGDIWNADKWEWSDFHGVPVSDDRIRAVKQYAGYTHYIKV